MLRDMAGRFSAAEIMAKINGETGGTFTRNAIIGRMARMKLKGRPQCSGNKRRTPKPQIVKTFEAPPVEVESLRIPFMGTEFWHCRFITEGEGLNAVCCGHPTADRSYCRWHLRVAYQPLQAKGSTHDRPRLSNRILVGL